MVAACVLPVPFWQEVSLRWDTHVLIVSGRNLLLTAPAAILIGHLGPRVSYRRRDWLLIFLPPLAIPVAWRIGCRLTRLDRQDWPHRPDEITPASAVPGIG
jgi:hypothetical protein